MNINQVTRLLNSINRKTISGESYIEQFHEQSENYYKLAKKDEKWVVLFVIGERKTEEVEEVKKVFDNESEASKYYYLFELGRYCWKQYIHHFIMKNEDINIGRYNCTIDNLKEAFDRIGIKENYYDFNNMIKKHSICLEKIDSSRSQFKFVGNGKNIIYKTLILENWRAYYIMFKDTYGLFLLDRYCEVLIKNKEIEKPFTDEEYKIFLRPGI